MTSFEVQVADDVLDDLRDRLRRTRWPDEVEGAGWSYGVSLAWMRELADYWLEAYDWRVHERAINQLPQIVVDGIHCVHIRRGKLPLLITHGWPSSFYETIDLVPWLDDFDLVIPSLPGYGFSERPRQPGMTSRRIAGRWLQLMETLGYERFAAHSYDVGGSVMSHILLDHPERVIGYHTTEPSNPRPWLEPPFSDAERDWMAYQDQWEQDEGSYFPIQRARPQTLAYGLHDSPVGLAAWILEKWQAWGDRPLSRDQLLTTVMIYWITETIHSANRLYYEGARQPRTRLREDRIPVPTAVALTTQRIESPPREYVERIYTNIQRWTQLPRGGHFIMLEEPGLVADSIRGFFL